jgi:hypothetical protein
VRSIDVCFLLVAEQSLVKQRELHIASDDFNEIQKKVSRSIPSALPAENSLTVLILKKSRKRVVDPTHCTSVKTRWSSLFRFISRDEKKLLQSRCQGDAGPNNLHYIQEGVSRQQPSDVSLSNMFRLHSKQFHFIPS